MDETSAIDPSISPYDPSIIFFYKAWDPYGAFSNFSHHQIHVPDNNGDYITWSSVEHYYQAHKFMGMNDAEVGKYIEYIVHAKNPEEAARKGRKLQTQQPDPARLSSTAVRPDWENVKVEIIYKAKFSIYPHLNSILLSTAGSVLVEASPHDLFWGGGREGEGMNYLGRLLMQLRSEFLGKIPPSGSSTVQAESENEART